MVHTDGMGRGGGPGLSKGVGALLAAAAMAGCGAASGGSSSRPTGGEEAGVVGPPGKIYVTMYGDDDITVFDQPTHAVLSKIPVGKGPAILVATPNGKKLYTADWAGNTISAVDVATSKVTPISLDGRPWAIAMSPTGDRVWSGLASNKLIAIDTATDAIVTTFDTSPNFPESVVVSGDGKEVYVDPTAGTDLGPGSFESLSATDGSVVHPSIAVGETPAFASISADGKLAYTLNFLAGTVSVVDTVSWTVVTTIDTGSGSQPIISSNTPGLLMVTNFGTGNLMTFDVKTSKLLHTIALDGRPVGVGGYDADGTLGYICDFGHASLAPESLTQGLDFLQGNLAPFVMNAPGHLTAFNPATGEKIGASMTVGKGPTSVLVLPP